MRKPLSLILLGVCISTPTIVNANNQLQIDYQQSIDEDQLQIDYQKSIDEDHLLSAPLRSVYQISERTYQYLDTAFSCFYQKLSFDTGIKNNTFNKSAHYEMLSVPLLSTNNNLIQLEVFGKLSDPNTFYLTNMSSDHTLYNYTANSQVLDIYSSDIGLGAGISFQTSDISKLKIIISDESLPGYGTSQALIGFESKF